MEIYDFRVHYKGFEPTKKEEQLIRSLLDRLHCEAPSDSAIRLEVSKGQVLFRTRCEIKSSVISFSGESASENLYPALKLVERKMHVQLDNWKTSRTNISRQLVHPMIAQSIVEQTAAQTA